MRPGTKTILTTLILFLTVWLTLRFLLPLFFPFLLGTALALAAEPMVAFLQKKTHIPRTVSTGIGVTAAFCFLAMLLLLLCAFLVRELGALAGIIPDLEQAARSGMSLVQTRLLQLASHTPKSIQPLLQENVILFFSDSTTLLDKAMGYALSLTGNLLSHVPDSALSLGTAVISGYMISAKLPKIRKWLLRRIPKEKLRTLFAAVKQIRTTLASWLTAQCKLASVTFVILVLGFILLRIPYALFWALGICLVDAFPVLGTGTVLLPWSLVQFLQGDNARAIGFLGIYVTVTLTRSMLEPKFLGRHLGLDPLVTLIALYAGYQLWGIGGMVLAPLLAVTAIQLVPKKQ